MGHVAVPCDLQLGHAAASGVKDANLGRIDDAVSSARGAPPPDHVLGHLEAGEGSDRVEACN